MDAVVLTYVVDELGKPQNEPDEIELSLCRKECGVRAIRIDAALGGGSQDARDARVRVLHVVDGVLVRLLHRELEIEVELPVGARLQEEVPRRVLTDRFDDLLEQQELSSPPSHPLEHALVQEAHVLVEDHLELLEQAERLHRRAPRITEDPLDTERCETLGLLLQRKLRPFVAVARLDLGRDVLHVLGWIRIGGYLDLLALELAITDRDGATEGVELRPGVLDVV